MGKDEFDEFDDFDTRRQSDEFPQAEVLTMPYDVITHLLSRYHIDAAAAISASMDHESDEYLGLWLGLGVWAYGNPYRQFLLAAMEKAEDAARTT